MSRRVYTQADVVKKSELRAKAEEQDFNEKIVKHIPTEIIAAWTAINGLLAATTDNVLLYWIVFIALAILTPIYIWRFTTEEKLPAARRQIAIAFCAFIIWVFGMGGPFTTINILNAAGEAVAWYQPIYGTAVLAIASIVLVIILKDKTVPSNPSGTP